MSSPGNPISQYGSGLYGNAPIESLPLGYYLGLLTSEYRAVLASGNVTAGVFEEDFSTDAVQSPLDPTKWLADLSGNFPNPLEIIDNSGPGVLGHVCVINTTNPVKQGMAYWSGDSPDDGYVQVRIGYLASDGAGLSVNYRAKLPQNNSKVPGGGYSLGINGPTGVAGAGEITLTLIDGGIDTLLDFTGLTLNSGDLVKVIYSGASHSVFQNEALLGSVTNGALLKGGPATVALGMVVDTGAQTDVQALEFKTSSSVFTNSSRSVKLNSFLYLLLKKFDDVSQCLTQMEQAFDVDNAIGVQLDVVGTMVGASRTLPFQPTGGLNPILGDSDYRTYLKSKAAQNQWDGTIDGLQSVWMTLFPGGQIAIADHQNMSATIFLTGTFSPIMQQMIINGLIVPRPQAVLYNYVFNLPAFGFDLNNSFIAGFDIGKWS